MVEKYKYCHELADKIEDWNALSHRLDDLKKRIDKLRLSPFMTEEDISSLLCLNRTWFAERRMSGKPPFYYKIGSGKRTPIRYSLAEVLDYLTMCCRRKSTTEDDHFDLETAEEEYFKKYDYKK